MREARKLPVRPGPRDISSAIRQQSDLAPVAAQRLDSRERPSGGFEPAAPRSLATRRPLGPPPQTLARLPAERRRTRRSIPVLRRARFRALASNDTQAWVRQSAHAPRRWRPPWTRSIRRYKSAEIGTSVPNRSKTPSTAGLVWSLGHAFIASDRMSPARAIAFHGIGLADASPSSSARCRVQQWKATQRPVRSKAPSRNGAGCPAMMAPPPRRFPAWRR